MATLEIETRVSALESEVEHLKSELAKISRTTDVWWKQIAGTFDDDPAHETAMQFGRDYRLAQQSEEADLQVDGHS